jgi:hypothetical protein
MPPSQHFYSGPVPRNSSTRRSVPLPFASWFGGLGRGSRDLFAWRRRSRHWWRSPLPYRFSGAVGKVRGSSQPCGCLGAGSARPFGTTNMLMGAALLAVTLVNLEGPQIGDADTVAAGTALLAVIMSVGWLLWTDRRHIRVVIGNVRKGTESI